MTVRAGHLSATRKVLLGRTIRITAALMCLLAVGGSRATGQGVVGFDTLVDAAERAYASADAYEARRSAICVDHYFQAARLSWQYVECVVGVARPGDEQYARAWSLYHRSLAGQ